MPRVKRTWIREPDGVTHTDEREYDYGTLDHFEEQVRSVEGEPDERDYVVTEDGGYLRLAYTRAGITSVLEYHP